MSEQETTPATMPEQEIEFRGRKMWVHMPTPEQLLVWKRTLTQLQRVDESTEWTADGVMSLMDRTRRIIDSVLVHRVDKDWLDDEMLDGTLSLTSMLDTGGIINKAVEAFATAAEAEGNRETRRAAKKTSPAKKAVRKRA